MNESKGIPVKVHMKTTILNNGEKEKNEFSTNGQLIFKASSTYLRFEEPANNDKDAADAAPVTTQTIRILKDRMTVVRHGGVSMNQQFVPGKETEGMYHSPYGQMAMRTKTKEFQFLWDKTNKQGSLLLRYALHLQEEKAGDYNLHLTIKEAHKDDEPS